MSKQRSKEEMRDLKKKMHDKVPKRFWNTFTEAQLLNIFINSVETGASDASLIEELELLESVMKSF